jgi:hypothetical protein
VERHEGSKQNRSVGLTKIEAAMSVEMDMTMAVLNPFNRMKAPSAEQVEARPVSGSAGKSPRPSLGLQFPCDPFCWPCLAPMRV